MKRRLLEGDSEQSDDWTTGHPLLFPNTLAVGSSAQPTFQFRLPVDDVTRFSSAIARSRSSPA